MFFEPSEEENVFFVRCDKTKDEAKAVFGDVKFVEGASCAFVTEKMTEKAFDEKADTLGGVLSKIRVYM